LKDISVRLRKVVDQSDAWINNPKSQNSGSSGIFEIADCFRFVGQNSNLLFIQILNSIQVICSSRALLKKRNCCYPFKFALHAGALLKKQNCSSATSSWSRLDQFDASINFEERPCKGNSGECISVSFSFLN
jgi:hypothetical protein